MTDNWFINIWKCPLQLYADDQNELTSIEISFLVRLVQSKKKTTQPFSLYVVQNKQYCNLSNTVFSTMDGNLSSRRP